MIEREAKLIWLQLSMNLQVAFVPGILGPSPKTPYILRPTSLNAKLRTGSLLRIVFKVLLY